MNLPMDLRTNVVLADYTWLPPELQPSFQAILEKADGIAVLHFLAAIERMNNKSVQKRVLAVSSEAIYFCTLQGDISRCITLRNIAEVLVCDEWVCFCIPTEYDVAFRIGCGNSNSNCHQNFLMGVLNGLRAFHGLSHLAPTVLTSVHAIASRQLERPEGLPVAKPLPIPVMTWDMFGSVPHADVLIQSLLPQHAGQCIASSPQLRQLQSPPANSPPRTETEELRMEESPTAAQDTATLLKNNAETTTQIHVTASPPHRALIEQQVQKKKSIEMTKVQSPPPSRASAAKDLLQLPALPSASPGRLNSKMPRFQDPCLELVWEELMNQRQAIQEIRMQMRLLVEEKFPGASGGDVKSAAAVATPQRQSKPSPTRTKTVQFQSPPDSAAGSRPVRTPPSQRKRQPPRGGAGHTDPNAARNNLEDMTAFQRALVSGFAQNIEPVVHAQFVLPNGSSVTTQSCAVPTSPQPRSSLNPSDFMGTEPHHQVLTKTARIQANNASARLRPSTTSTNSGLTRAAAPRFSSPTASSAMRVRK